MTDTTFRPKFITFDCYGTLTRFQMNEMAQKLYGDRVEAARMPDFCKDFAAYRLDEVLGAWKPYAQVIADALRRSSTAWQLEYRDADAQAIVEAIPSWGPHPDVAAGLSRIAGSIPLVALSNASNSQIGQNIEKLGSPFHQVYTAEQAQAYKPRLRAFEYMLDQLGADPKDIMHVSGSFRYDLMTAHDMRFGARVHVARGYEPVLAPYMTHKIDDIGGLPGLVGL